MMNPPNPQPLVCDMSTAPDTPHERMAEYARLFEHALVGSERTADALSWRFTARAGVEAWVRDLADREAACCPFFTYSVTATDGEVVFTIAADPDPMLQGILAEMHDLPERIGDGLPRLLARLNQRGLDVRAADSIG